MKKVLLLLALVLSLSSFTDGPFKAKEKTVALRLQNPDMSLVEISVWDAEGRKVFNLTTAETEIGKLFNFEDALPNTYTIVVVDGKDKFQRVVVID